VATFKKIETGPESITKKLARVFRSRPVASTVEPTPAEDTPAKTEDDVAGPFGVLRRKTTPVWEKLEREFEESDNRLAAMHARMAQLQIDTARALDAARRSGVERAERELHVTTKRYYDIPEPQRRFSDLGSLLELGKLAKASVGYSDTPNAEALSHEIDQYIAHLSQELRTAELARMRRELPPAPVPVFEPPPVEPVNVTHDEDEPRAFKKIETVK
jgi:hypothetical protein